MRISIKLFENDHVLIIMPNLFVNQSMNDELAIKLEKKRYCLSGSKTFLQNLTHSINIVFGIAICSVGLRHLSQQGFIINSVYLLQLTGRSSSWWHVSKNLTHN